MAIRWTEDVGAPVAVTAVNYLARASMPQWHDMIVYAMAIGGYVADGMNWGRGDFMKNVGIAAAPLALDKLWERFGAGTVAGRTVARRASYRGVSRYPAPAFEREFANVRLD